MNRNGPLALPRWRHGLDCLESSASPVSYSASSAKGRVWRSNPAFGYAAEKEHTFPKSDQFGAELLYFSRCILEDRTPEPRGPEGLADVRVIEAILESAAKGRPVELETVEKPRGSRPEQQIVLPPVERPRVVHAPSPKQ